MFESLLSIPVEAWRTLCEMAPYLLFGFGVAGVLSVFISPAVVERHLGGRGLWPVVNATLFGIPLPLCSCGVIPVAASLRRHGATRGATASFLLSTPQTGVDSIMVTLGLLGPVFAVFRPLVALVTGLVGGTVVTMVDREGGGVPEEERCQDACCTGENGGNRILGALRYAFITLPADIGKALLVGLLIVGVISAFVPDDFFAGVIGTGIGAMFVMMLVGLPMYVCATASVPIAAALIAKGVTPGAAFVFLATGPATNAATFATIWRLMGRRTAVIYLLTVAVCAVLSGVVLDMLFVSESPLMEHSMGWMLPGYVKVGSAVVLLVVLAYGVVMPNGAKRTLAPAADSAAGSDQGTSLCIEGMTCAHCAESVRAALLACSGVEAADVDLQSGKAIVRGKGLSMDNLVEAVRKAGYGAHESCSH